MRERLGAAAVVVLLVLGACGAGDDGALEGDVPEVTTTTTTPTTTTAPTTTTTEPACPAVLEGAGNPGQVDVSADLDGDGEPDRVHSFRAEGDQGPWALQVVLAAGGGAIQSLPGDDVAGVAVVGGYDLDGDGADELWVRIGAGASAQIVGLFHLDGCDLEPVVLGGTPIELPVGGSVGSAAGVSCPADRGDGDLVTTALTSEDGGAYDVEVTSYRYADGVLTEDGTSTTTVVAGTPAHDAAVGFHCDDLAL